MPTRMPPPMPAVVPFARPEPAADSGHTDSASLTIAGFPFELTVWTAEALAQLPESERPAEALVMRQGGAFLLVPVPQG